MFSAKKDPLKRPLPSQIGQMGPLAHSFEKDPQKAQNMKDFYIVEKILDKRFVDGEFKYKVKWLNYPSNQCTWEPKENLKNVSLMLKYFDENFDRQHGIQNHNQSTPNQQPKRDFYKENNFKENPFKDSNFKENPFKENNFKDNLHPRKNSSSSSFGEEYQNVVPVHRGPGRPPKNPLEFAKKNLLKKTPGSGPFAITGKKRGRKPKEFREKKRKHKNLLVLRYFNKIWKTIYNLQKKYALTSGDDTFSSDSSAKSLEQKDFGDWSSDQEDWKEYNNGNSEDRQRRLMMKKKLKIEGVRKVGRPRKNPLPNEMHGSKKIDLDGNSEDSLDEIGKHPNKLLHTSENPMGKPIGNDQFMNNHYNRIPTSNDPYGNRPGDQFPPRSNNFSSEQSQINRSSMPNEQTLNRNNIPHDHSSFQKNSDQTPSKPETITTNFLDEITEKNQGAEPVKDSKSKDSTRNVATNEGETEKEGDYPVRNSCGLPEYGDFNFGDKAKSILSATPGNLGEEVMCFVEWFPRADGFVPKKSKVSNNVIKRVEPNLLVAFYESKLRFNQGKTKEKIKSIEGKQTAETSSRNDIASKEKAVDDLKTGEEINRQIHKEINGRGELGKSYEDSNKERTIAHLISPKKNGIDQDNEFSKLNHIENHIAEKTGFLSDELKDSENNKKKKNIETLIAELVEKSKRDETLI